jgi:hypothetical protein
MHGMRVNQPNVRTELQYELHLLPRNSEGGTCNLGKDVEIALLELERSLMLWTIGTVIVVTPLTCLIARFIH